jgi:hypothetical protein
MWAALLTGAKGNGAALIAFAITVGYLALALTG